MRQNQISHYLTFSPAEGIYNVTKPQWGWVALGPLSGLLLQSNRILIPGDYSTSNIHYSTNFVVINDFNGQGDKWYLDGQFPLDNYYPNEGQAVELLPNSNSIFVNARSYKTVRIGAYRNDCCMILGQIKVLHTLVEPIYGSEGPTLHQESTCQLLYSGLAETTMRSNLSLYLSMNDDKK